MLFISSLFWLLYVSETARLATRTRVALSIIGFVTGIASLLGVLGAQSKGAWLALAATTVFMTLLGLSYSRGPRRIQPIAILLILIAISATIALPFVEKVAGSTMTASNALTNASIATGDVMGAVANTIEDPGTPQAMRERLMLWMNAWELVQMSPVVGWGNLWLREWPQTRYANVGYTLLHNGYLELLVRHGLVGLAFLVLFTITAARRLNAARLSGALSPSLAGYLYSIAFFFLCTIASNSNNRLALGESFFILAGSSVFALTLLRRNTQGKDAPGHNGN
jgi:O-antigen ligase